MKTMLEKKLVDRMVLHVSIAAMNWGRP